VKTTGTAVNVLKTGDNAQYTGAVAWKTVIDPQDPDKDKDFAVDTQFEAARAYKAEVTLTPVAGKFTFTGFAGTFTHTGASSIAQEAGAGADEGKYIVTLTFPATAAPEATAEVTLDPLVVTSSTGNLANIVLTKGSTENVVLTVSSSATGFTVGSTAKWYVDGQTVKADAGTSNAKLTLKPADYAVRASAHHVTVTATVDTKLYSVTVPFTVVAASN
jgi:hypothetical protein